jgi:hypothetical protein
MFVVDFLGFSKLMFWWSVSFCLLNCFLPLDFPSFFYRIMVKNVKRMNINYSINLKVNPKMFPIVFRTILRGCLCSFSSWSKCLALSVSGWSSSTLRKGSYFGRAGSRWVASIFPQWATPKFVMFSLVGSCSVSRLYYLQVPTCWHPPTLLIHIWYITVFL